MERNIKLRTIEDYYDLVLEKNVSKNEIFWYGEERARQLCEKKVAEIIEIRKCIDESK